MYGSTIDPSIVILPTVNIDISKMDDPCERDKILNYSIGSKYFYLPFSNPFLLKQLLTRSLDNLWDRIHLLLSDHFSI